jgi:hypothetical protein
MRRIVVHLRTCPTRLLGPYGCEWIDTPALNRLAAEGIVFDGHYLQSQPASQRPDPENQLTQSGTSHSYASIVPGFDFDRIAESLQQLSQQDHGFVSINADPFALPWPEWESQQIDWDDESSREDFFAAYEAKIASCDEQMDELLEAITQRGLEKSSLLIFTATSGLPLGEHGVIGTADSRLHEELVHLPLIVRFPDRRLAGYRVAGFTTPDDLNELLATGSTERLEALILGIYPTRQMVVSRCDNEVSLRTADSCLMQPLGDNPNPPLLFELPDDRFEVNNLAERQSDRVEDLKMKFGLNAETAEAAKGIT